MSWAACAFIAAFVGLLGAACAWGIAALCVEWYEIPSMDFQAAFFVFVVMLFGGVGSSAGGFVLARLLHRAWLPTLGIASGSVIGLGAVALLICWVLADIPPEWNGHSLDLVVEFKLPKDAPDPATLKAEDVGVAFSSSRLWSQTRWSRMGQLLTPEARREGDRWVVPGRVHIFTTSGKRAVTYFLDGTRGFGFELPLPGHPGPEFAKWSGWLPEERDGKPWPEDRAMYRFRVEEVVPPPPPPDPQVVRAQKFAALKADATLADLLEFESYEAPAEWKQKITDYAVAHPKELAAAIRDPKQEGVALAVVGRVPVIAPEVIAAMNSTVDDLAAEIEKFYQMDETDSRYYDVALQIRTRFEQWRHAWWHVHGVAHLDGRPPLERLMALARSKPQGKQVDDILINGEAHLKALEPVAATR
jgi:hypothetical protein